MFYILVLAPMDQCFVGPFDNVQAANDHAATIRDKRRFDALVMTAAERTANVAEFGALPICSPREDLESE